MRQTSYRMERIVRNDYVTRSEASRHVSSAYDVEGFYWANEASLRRGRRRFVSQERAIVVRYEGRKASHRVRSYTDILIVSHKGERYDVRGVEKATMLWSIASLVMNRCGGGGENVYRKTAIEFFLLPYRYTIQSSVL